MKASRVLGTAAVGVAVGAGVLLASGDASAGAFVTPAAQIVTDDVSGAMAIVAALGICGVVGVMLWLGASAMMSGIVGLLMGGAFMVLGPEVLAGVFGAGGGGGDIAQVIATLPGIAQ